MQPTPRVGSGVGVVVLLVITALVGLGPAACVPRAEPSCIEQPRISSKEAQRDAAEASVKLEKLQIDASLKQDFQRVIETEFQKLDHPDVTFLLTLRGIECLMRRAKTPQQQQLVRELAPQLLDIARARYAAAQGVKGVGPTLSDEEREAIAKSPYAREILGELEKLGVK